MRIADPATYAATVGHYRDQLGLDVTAVDGERCPDGTVHEILGPDRPEAPEAAGPKAHPSGRPARKRAALPSTAVCFADRSMAPKRRAEAPCGGLDPLPCSMGTFVQPGPG